MNLYADRINRLGTENAFKLGDDIRRCEQMGMRVSKLNLGEPDFNTAENINRVAIDHSCQGTRTFTKLGDVKFYDSRPLAVVSWEPQLWIARQVGSVPEIPYPIVSRTFPGL